MPMFKRKPRQQVPLEKSPMPAPRDPRLLVVTDSRGVEVLVFDINDEGTPTLEWRQDSREVIRQLRGALLISARP
ncbi:hypothetical protein SEA_SIXAMA_87 [Gordonia phage Sixama]|uniref:Uncharacterized protein n=1 Tax=Gordonia phage Sixama TaxID=2653271 RepID=A0A5Q2F814_9CAUD|nr:hypothetical protein PP302_gp087 [Gordonia phage Sixama]QGF20266.1 hypothetical protein SEA_SIXAMA_87 [Gordonia phage Sixama]